MKKLIFLISFLFLSMTSFSQLNQKLNEKYFESIFANAIDGEMEVKLTDKSRVDIVTDTFAIEVEFAKKWAESIGQSLYYAYVLEKKPGIVLIIEKESDNNFLKRLLVVTTKQNITVWLLDARTKKWKKITKNNYY